MTGGQQQAPVQQNPLGASTFFGTTQGQGSGQGSILGNQQATTSMFGTNPAQQPTNNLAVSFFGKTQQQPTTGATSLFGQQTQNPYGQPQQ